MFKDKKDYEEYIEKQKVKNADLREENYFEHNDNGEIILKKYSPIGELSEFATGYAETLAKTTGHIACITDKDTIIAVSGGSKKEFLEQDVSRELEKLMEDKEVYTSKENSDKAQDNGSGPFYCEFSDINHPYSPASRVSSITCAPSRSSLLQLVITRLLLSRPDITSMRPES